MPDMALYLCLKNDQIQKIINNYEKDFNSNSITIIMLLQ